MTCPSIQRQTVPIHVFQQTVDASYGSADRIDVGEDQGTVNAHVWFLTPFGDKKFDQSFHFSDISMACSYPEELEDYRSGLQVEVEACWLPPTLCSRVFAF